VDSHFCRCVLIDEFINGKVTTSNSDLDSAEFDTDHYSFLSKNIDAFGFSHEHYLQLGSVRVIVDPFSQTHVYVRPFDGNVYCDSRSNVDQLALQGLDLVLKSFIFGSNLHYENSQFFKFFTMD
jgi:hypothetical protein